MPTIKGVLSFPALFTPKVAQGATEAKYGVSILLPPTDPQLPALQAEVEAAKANTFPSGMPPTAEVPALAQYDTKYAGKDYYDPRFTGWWVVSCSAKADDKPAVVDMNHDPIIDAGQVCSGAIAHVNLGISGYKKGKGGVGGWLNGVMATGELCEFGRLDGKPSVDQMFANVGAPPVAATPPPAPPVAATPPPAPPAPPVAATPPPAPPAPQYQMTAAAGGQTREAMIAVGWTDETLISNGMMLPPNGVTPSFA